MISNSLRRENLKENESMWEAYLLAWELRNENRIPSEAGNGTGGRPSRTPQAQKLAPNDPDIAAALAEAGAAQPIAC